MLSFEKLVEQKNLQIRESYLSSLEKIKTIRSEVKDSEDKYKKYLFAIADKILLFAEFEQEVTDDYFKQNSLEKLKQTNHDFFNEVMPQNYNSSYADPAYLFMDDHLRLRGQELYFKTIASVMFD